MEFKFSNNKLKELYETGQSKKYKLPKNILKKFFMRIQDIEAATTIYDLWTKPALNFEKYKSIYSIRVDGSWRLEFDVKWEDKEKTKGEFLIKELSNHYGD